MIMLTTAIILLTTIWPTPYPGDARMIERRRANLITVCIVITAAVVLIIAVNR